MKTHPEKLIVTFPMYKRGDYRWHLVAIDDQLVVHRRSPIDYLMELRPIVRLGTSGKNSHGAALLRLAADLKAGYTVVIVKRDGFLADLEALAREHAKPSEQDVIEQAVQVVAERTPTQVMDHMDTDDTQYQLSRLAAAAQPRCTKADRSGNGFPTPRAEQMWHALRHEWTDVRSNQAGRMACERWIARNRPDMPRTEV